MSRRFPAIALAALLFSLGAGVDALQAQSANGLLPGDVVRIQIWREEDLSGEFQLDEGGTVVLPLLGPKAVMGISPDRLRDQLTDEYADYLVNTAVNVTLLRRIAVLGEVRVPGVYTIDATNSVATVDFTCGMVYRQAIRNVATYAGNVENTWAAYQFGAPVYYDRSSTMPATSHLSLSPLDNNGVANPLFGFIVAWDDADMAAYPKGAAGVAATTDCAVMQRGAGA